MDYIVSWEINIAADSAREAAEIALKIQRDPNSIATVFAVVNVDDKGDHEVVDLEQE